MLKILYFTCFTFLTAGFLAKANDLFHHEIKNYPSNNQTCDSVSQMLATQFSNAAKVEIYWASGKKISNTECDIKISYIASERLSLPANIDRDSFSSVGWRGVYSSIEDCEKYLSFEKELFIQQTGLTPWTTFCAKETYFASSQKYYPLIEAIGTPSNWFFASDSLLFGAPVRGWEAVLNELKNGAKARGLALASISVASSGVGLELRARFYSKERQWLANERFGGFIDPNTCESQIERIKSNCGKSVLAPLGFYCSKESGRVTITVISLTSDVIDSKSIKETIDPKTYSTLAACSENVSGTEKLYSDTFKKSVLVGFCINPSPNIFQVVILEDPIKH